MTWKFKAKRKTDLNIMLLIPINGEEPVLIQFHNGYYETDDDDIGRSMIQSEFYKKLFVKNEYPSQEYSNKKIKKNRTKKQRKA